MKKKIQKELGFALLGRRTWLLFIVLLLTTCAADCPFELNGTIIFDSNRSGTFGIYSINGDGTNLQVVVDSEAHEIYPDPSPDGQYIVYARSFSTDRHAESDIWMVDRAGTNACEVVKNGTFPTFSADGTKIYFERKRRKVMSVKRACAVGEVAPKVNKLFPLKGSQFKKRAVVKPRVSSDGRYVAFTSDIPNPWNAWYADLKSGEAFRIGHGCSPTWYSGSEQIAFVSRKDAQAGSGLYRFERSSPGRSTLQDEGAPFGHEYHPSIVDGDRVVLYGSCPADQHDQITSNYQIYGKDIHCGAVQRLTNDSYNNRWPKFIAPPPESTAAN